MTDKSPDLGPKLDATPTMSYTVPFQNEEQEQAGEAFLGPISSKFYIEDIGEVRDAQNYREEHQIPLEIGEPKMFSFYSPQSSPLFL
jgi:hypothetical protein